MSRCTLVFFLVFSYGISLAQNLVPNPSFEDMLGCPTGLGDFSVGSWVNPTTASPDYFQSCGASNVGIPQNAFGWQIARTGNAYVGVHTSDFSSTDYREYIQCQLNTPLQSGKFYRVNFYVSRTDSSTKACDNIGAFFSTAPIGATDNINLPYSPQVVSPPNNPITDDIGWVLISDTICASGGEEYLTIGVFTNNSNTNWIPIGGGWESEAHYYIDDVSVEEILISSPIEALPDYLTIFPNPSSGLIYIESPEFIKTISIYSELGQLVFTSNSNSKSMQVELLKIPNGIYYVDITASSITSRRKIVIINH